MSDRILVMHGGRIRQLGAPEDIYARPRDVFVAEVVGAANFFDVTVRGEEMQLFVAFDAAGTTFLAAQATTGAGVARAMIRPDRLGIDHGMGGGPRPNVLRGWIRQRLFMGGIMSTWWKRPLVWREYFRHACSLRGAGWCCLSRRRIVSFCRGNEGGLRPDPPRGFAPWTSTKGWAFGNHLFSE